MVPRYNLAASASAPELTVSLFGAAERPDVRRRREVSLIMKLFVLLLALASSLIPVWAAAEGESFTEALMRSTFKIAGQDTLGTAFILGKSDPKNEGRSFYILITAAHVLEGMKGEFATLFLRTRKGEVYTKLPHRIRIRNEQVPIWSRHPDLDVAAMPVPIPPEADIYLASTDFLATDERIRDLEINAGDEVFVLGYPYGVESNEAGFPILRSGKIASFPLLPTVKTKSFLLDFEVFTGNSGGPVFIDQQMRTIGSAARVGNFVSVLGIVSQERSVTEKIQSIEGYRVKSHKLGLAVVVHASFLAELVESIAIPTE